MQRLNDYLYSIDKFRKKSSIENQAFDRKIHEKTVCKS